LLDFKILLKVSEKWLRPASRKYCKRIVLLTHPSVVTFVVNLCTKAWFGFNGCKYFLKLFYCNRWTKPMASFEENGSRSSLLQYLKSWA